MRVADPQCGNVDVTSTASQVRNADAKGETDVTEGLSPLTNTEQTLTSHSHVTRMSRVEKHKQAGWWRTRVGLHPSPSARVGTA